MTRMEKVITLLICYFPTHFGVLAMKLSHLALTLLLLGSAGFAQAQNCTVKLEGNDRMQFDQKEVTVNASCRTITLELHHVGTLPAAAMGHNIVVTATADANAVAADGLKAGASAGFLKANDERIIGHTDLIGGGQTTTATFPGNKLTAGGDYTFFCSFAGHTALMRGKLVVVP